MAEEVVKVIITAEDRGAGANVDKLTGSLSGLASMAGGPVTVALKGLTMIATAAVAGFTALGAGLGFAIKQAMDAEKVTVQLGAAIRSMGTGFAVEQVLDWVDALSMATGLSDELVLEGANKLLTFGNVTQDIFEEALGLAADLSVAWGQDLNSSAIQLGKALNDPIAGMTALSRVGVTFTQEQKDLIRSLQESGDMLGAQTIIMEELRRQVGGSAEAFGTTLAGSIQKLNNLFGNTAELIGGLFTPALTELINFILPPLQSGFEMLSGFIDKVKSQFEIFNLQVAAGMDPSIAFRNVLANLVPPWLFDSVMNLVTAVTGFLDVLRGQRGSVQDFAGTVGGVFANAVQNILPKAIDLGAAALTMFTNLWRQYGPQILAIAKLVAGGLGTSFSVGLGMALDVATRAISGIERLFRAFQRGGWEATFKELGSQIMQGLVQGIQANPQAVQKALDTIITAAIQAIKERLGIASPSAVMRDLVGKNMMLGIAEGIKVNAKVPTLALADAGVKTVNSVAAGNAGGGNTYNFSGAIFQVPNMATMDSLMRDINVARG